MKRIFFTITCFAILIIQACTEIFSPDITTLKVRVLSPSESICTGSETLSFFWEEEADVEAWHLRIVSPDFLQPNIILDTLLTDHSVSILLDKIDASYAWQLWGENESSSTEKIQRSFFVDVSPPFVPGTLVTNGDTLHNEDSLSWTSGDSFLGQIEWTDDSLRFSQVNDSSASGNGFSIPQGTRSFSIQSAAFTEGWYWWSVSSKDCAGNRTQSAAFSFYFKPD